jgi:thiazole/oxazole-forming peptide maturase SagD family component
VLPPDVVCLYSEDRKFFLHGELYCALASAIGKGGQSLQELAGELGRKFPADKVEEALKRLIERRYIVPATDSSSGAVAGYWASLGLPPGIAEQNLGNCRVRVESIDVKGAAEFGNALSKLGVRVVDRSPDLTITLANDYLERRLAEINRQRVSERTPWLLVQPSGAFPLVGPVFRPGSGGYRTVSSRRTVARFRMHVSPLTGVVTRLERIEADLPMNTNYHATHNFSAPAQNVDQLRAGLSGGSVGKGSTAEQAEASALMEAIERYSGIFQGDEIRVTRRFTDFAPGDAVLPNDILLFSDAQSQRDAASTAQSGEVQLAPPEFDPSARIEWSPVWSLRDGRFKYIPTTLVYFFYSGPAAFRADSNGCAAGNTIEEAIVQGFLELVERDAYAIWWYNRSQRAEVDLSQFDDSYVRDLHSQLADAGRKLWVLDVTSDLGVPTYVAILHWMQNGQENIEFGSGAHFDKRIALLRTLTELNQFLSIGLMGGGSGEKPSLDGVAPLHLQEHPFLTPSSHPVVLPGSDSHVSTLDNTRDQVLACVELARRAGLDFLVLNQTRPDVEVPVVRVIVPGLRHFYQRFAPGRLYEVPVKLGLRDRPLPESELTPFPPHS